jgi:hypothetical protein
MHRFKLCLPLLLLGVVAVLVLPRVVEAITCRATGMSASDLSASCNCPPRSESGLSLGGCHAAGSSGSGEYLLVVPYENCATGCRASIYADWNCTGSFPAYSKTATITACQVCSGGGTICQTYTTPGASWTWTGDVNSDDLCVSTCGAFYVGIRLYQSCKEDPYYTGGCDADTMTLKRYVYCQVCTP